MAALCGREFENMYALEAIDGQKATETLESQRFVYYPYCNNFFFPELVWRIFV
jgi:hypothetical protein